MLSFECLRCAAENLRIEAVRSNSAQAMPPYMDLSTCEIKRISAEKKFYGTVLSPCGQRVPSSQQDRKLFIATIQDKYHYLSPQQFRLTYATI